MTQRMYVVKRNGTRVDVQFDAITRRIRRLSSDLPGMDAAEIAMKVISYIATGMQTREIDVLAAETAAFLSIKHPDYGTVAGRLAVTNLHKDTEPQFTKVIADIVASGEISLCPQFVATVHKHGAQLDAAIVHARDLTEFSYFGFKVLEKTYLLRVGGKIIERPQHMLMRTALAIHGDDIECVLETYDMMSRGLFIHASPTLFNAGMRRQQLASCFLLTMRDDSIEGIYQTLQQCAVISKSGGGIGLAISNIRAKGSVIRGTNGVSNGVVPMLQVFNSTARYVDQGGGKRKGSIAVYLEPWHADVEDFLALRRNTGATSGHAHDLYCGLWIPDLFMRRVEADAAWTLFCPTRAPGLMDAVGPAFDTLYERYEREGCGSRTLQARALYKLINDVRCETGTPYMLFKDASNTKSNQQNLGTIHCSNLCTEILQYSSVDEVAVCNLASIALPKFVVPGAAGERATFDFSALASVVETVTSNLNRVIDRSHEPIAEAATSNRRNRPVGIGVQGLADAFILMRMPFDSAEARALNRDIFETIYHAALTRSCALAAQLGAYESYAGSPVSRGILQHDMWGVEGDIDWAPLRARIARHGVRNSLLIAPMPTASTSSILGNNECIEPYTSNIYVRRVLSGEFVMINKHLVADLQKLGLWTDAMKHRIIQENGSVQNIAQIPADVRELYKTVWEIKQRCIVDMAADRGAFIDQSQSLNLHVAAPTAGIMSSMDMHAWKSGLKTGCYYLRTKPAAAPIKFTLDADEAAKLSSLPPARLEISPTTEARLLMSPDPTSMPGDSPIFPAPLALCDKDDGEGCLSCGS